MSAADIEPVLEKIHELRNFDFASYKKSTLVRRIERRMSERKCGHVADYVAILEREPDEVGLLLQSMLIKVTSFLRDPDLWSHLSQKVLPEFLATKRDDELRIWCAGCATGEEAYTVAILLAECLAAAFPSYRVKIFGTDVDEAAIAVARRGVYSEKSLEPLPAEWVERWFVKSPEGWSVRKELRRIIVFGVNNLDQDAPISRLDLITCRNVFIYLDSALQKRVLSRFHYALRSNGLLVLGKAELIPFATKIFEPVALPLRIYRKDGKREASATQRLMELLEKENSRRAAPGDEGESSNVLTEFYRDALDSLHLPVIVTSHDGTISLWNRAAGHLWERSEPEVIGQKLSALALSGLPGELLVEKTALVRDGKSVREVMPSVINAQGRTLHVLAHVVPLRTSNRELGLVYTLEDASETHSARDEAVLARDESKKSREQLQKWTEQQQSSNEELETTNEELQSANEELQTTNEELQSTNEELETTNEELQSTNAELDATNHELASRTEQVNVLSTYQRAIIRSVSAAVIVLDAFGRITNWNLAAERLLGVQEAEALGQSLWTLHVPALRRSLIGRVRRGIAERKALRMERLRIRLPGGAEGFATLAAIPLLENEQHLGSIILVEDATSSVSMANDMKAMKRKLRPAKRTPRPGKSKRRGRT